MPFQQNPSLAVDHDHSAIISLHLAGQSTESFTFLNAPHACINKGHMNMYKVQ